MKNISKILLSVFLIIELIIYSDVVIKSASAALETCFNVLLPSLFPFFVLSRIFISSGGAELFGRPFNFIMRPLFRIDGSGASAFILGIISGYPVGAKTAVELYNQTAITKKEAESLICFCNNSGPLFIIGALGVGMLSSKEAGIFLYVIHILSAITLGLILRFTLPVRRTTRFKFNMKTADSNIFTSAVENSVLSVINVCAYVIFFAVIMDICEAMSAFLLVEKNYLINSILFSFFEMTTGIKKLSAADCTLSLKLILSSLILGWSGLSIHFQTKSILGKADLSFIKYITAKLIHGIIAAIYTSFALRFIPISRFVFSSSADNVHIITDTSSYPVLATMIIVIIYITVRLRSKCSTRYSRLKQRTAR